MFQWLKGRSSDPPAVANEPEELTLDSMRAADRAVVFKHSRSCPVSWFANTQVRRFAARHPHVPVYTVLIQENRQLSGKIAEWIGVRHESPQVILLRQGNVISSASHEGVTEDYIAGVLNAAELESRP